MSPRASTYEDTGRLAGPELAAALGLESQRLEEGSSLLPGCPTDVWTAKDDNGTAYCAQVDHVTTDRVEQWDIAMRLAGTVPTPEEIRRYENDLEAGDRGN